MYIDFIFKQILEYFVRNLLVYTALFFGEKYIIEFLTKKTIDSFVFNTHRLFSSAELSFSDFFYTIVSTILYTIAIVLIFIILV